MAKLLQLGLLTRHVASVALFSCVLCCGSALGRRRLVSGQVTTISTNLLNSLAEPDDHLSRISNSGTYFGWDTGGTVSVNLVFQVGWGRGAASPQRRLTDPADCQNDTTKELMSEPMVVMLVDEFQIETLEDELRSARDDGRCYARAYRRAVASGNLSVLWTAPVGGGRFTVVVCDCFGMMPVVAGSVVFLSSAGGELGVDEKALPGVFTVMTVLYMVLGVFWSTYFARTPRRFRAPLHNAIIWSVLFRGLWMAASAAAMRRVKEDGRISYGQHAFVTFVEGISVFFTFYMIWLLGSGASIVRTELLRAEKALMISTLPCSALVIFLYPLCSETWVCYSLKVARFLVISSILVASVLSTQLSVYILRARAPLRWADGGALNYVKLGVYLRFRQAFVAFLLHDLVLLAIDSAFLDWQDLAYSRFLSLGSQLLIEMMLMGPFIPTDHRSRCLTLDRRGIPADFDGFGVPVPGARGGG